MFSNLVEGATRSVNNCRKPVPSVEPERTPALATVATVAKSSSKFNPASDAALPAY